MSLFRQRFRHLCFYLLTATLPVSVWGADQHDIRGTVTDPLGAVVVGAEVALLEDTQVAASTTTDQVGQFRLPFNKRGRQKIRILAASFHPTLVDVPYAPGSGDVLVNVTLSLEPLAQQVTVTATGTPTPQAQLGAAVSLLDPSQYSFTHDVEEALRLVPSLQVTGTGQRGGTTSLFIRGGYDNYNKVLVDGIPVNDIGGQVEFANLALTGTDKVEVLRAPNSALYGADALAGVVSLTTARGTTPLPQVTYKAGGDNFGTYEQEGTLGGAHKQFDYFSDVLRFDTANSIPNSSFHNGTYAGNFGWRPLANTSLRATARRIAVSDGYPKRHRVVRDSGRRPDRKPRIRSSELR